MLDSAGLRVYELEALLEPTPAHRLLNAAFARAKYNCAMVRSSLQDGLVEQGELDLDDGMNYRSGLMTAIDQLKLRYGQGTVAMASAGTAGARRSWTMSQDRKAPDNTTCWKSMPLPIT